MAQNRIVRGVVFDENKNPLTGIMVSAEGSTETVLSTDGGQFELSVSPYTKNITAMAEGYFPTRAEIDGSYLILTLKVDKKYFEDKLKAEETARLATERETQAKAKAEEEARLAAEREAKAKTKAEEKARLAAEKNKQTVLKSEDVNIATETNVIKQIINEKLKNIDIGVAVTYDPLITLGEGWSHIGLDLDFVDSSSQTNFNIYGMFNTGVYVYDDDERDGNNYSFSYDVNVGVGCGIPISRKTEFTPYATLGGYFENDYVYSIVEPGARFTFRFQPFSILLGIGYQFWFNKDYLGEYRWDDWQLSFKAGIKWTF